MKPSFLDSLSKHQFLLTSVVIGLFLASGAFFSTNYFNNQIASITEASCYLQSEVNAKESELANLNGQASSIQNEILQLEQSIISLSSSQTTDGYTIDTLKAEIRSDYDISQEEKRMKWICDAENSAGADFTASSDTPSCSDVTAYYNSIKSNNEYKKTLLANLEAQSGSSNMDYLTSTLSERRSTLQNLTGVQIPELTQLIGLYKSDICPDKELVCDDSLDNDRDGAGDCKDTDCQWAASCMVVSGDANSGGAGAGNPDLENNNGANPNLPLPDWGTGYIDPSLFTFNCDGEKNSRLSGIDSAISELNSKQQEIGRQMNDPAYQSQISALQAMYDNLGSQISALNQSRNYTANCTVTPPDLSTCDLNMEQKMSLENTRRSLESDQANIAASIAVQEAMRAGVDASADGGEAQLQEIDSRLGDLRNQAMDNEHARMKNIADIADFYDQHQKCLDSLYTDLRARGY